MNSKLSAKSFLQIMLIFFFSMLIFATYQTLKIANKDYEGVMDKNYYEKGLNFEKELNLKNTLLKEGYELKFQNSKLNIEDLKIEFTKNGKFIPNQKIKLLIERPNTSKENMEFVLDESKEYYTKKIETLKKGKWIFNFSVELKNGILEKRELIEII